MDWNAAIEKNREALKRVLALLVGLAGLTGQSAFLSRDGAPSQGPAEQSPVLPRRLHRFVLGLLRPAEAAARRLVIVAARGLVLPPPRPRKPKPRPYSIFVRPGEMRTGIVLPRGVRRSAILPALARPRPRRLALPLFDPLPRFGGRPRPAARGVPRIWAPGYGEPFPVKAPPRPGDPIDAGRLLLRFEALGRALDDLPREARRFALWVARRDAANARIKQELDAAGVQIPVELYRIGARNRSRAAGAQDKKDVRPSRRQWPLRPGRPPGSRRRSTHEVHDILNAAHGLAILALEREDTS